MNLEIEILKIEIYDILEIYDKIILTTVVSVLSAFVDKLMMTVLRTQNPKNNFLLRSIYDNEVDCEADCHFEFL